MRTTKAGMKGRVSSDEIRRWGWEAGHTGPQRPRFHSIGHEKQEKHVLAVDKKVSLAAVWGMDCRV